MQFQNISPYKVTFHTSEGRHCSDVYESLYQRCPFLQCSVKHTITDTLFKEISFQNHKSDCLE